jgi:hypothetical protein
MSGQSRKHSVFESIANVLIGTALALATQCVVFPRVENDWYPTPEAAVFPLIPFIKGGAGNQSPTYIEPCAGDGRLIRRLKKHGLSCLYACDINPRAPGIEKKDVLFFGEKLPPTKLIITNPAWDRVLLHAMIEKFRLHAPTWLLFDADWAFTGQAKPFLKFCERIVVVGRISWAGNGVSGMDNCAWYKFGKEESKTIFSA